MKTVTRCYGWLLISLLLAGCQSGPFQSVGPVRFGGHLTSTGQLLHPAGDTLEMAGRPVDLVLAPDGRTLYVKDNRGITVIDVTKWKVRQFLRLAEKKNGSSTHGIVVTRDGLRVYVSGAHQAVWELGVRGDGSVKLERTIPLYGPKTNDSSHVAGLALSTDEKTLYACLSRNNSLACVDLETGTVSVEIPVGVAPYDVTLKKDGKTAFVSNWGGRRAVKGEKTAESSGTDTLVDDRGVAVNGTVSVVDLEKGAQVEEIAVGLHPSDLELGADDATLYVANANSDSVSVIDTATGRALDSILVRPDPSLLFGSAPNALALSRDGRNLFVANGGNNAVTVLGLHGRQPATIDGFIPAAWYPGGVVTDGKFLFVANVKGLGSRDVKANTNGWNSHYYRGTVSKVEIPAASVLHKYTEQVKADTRVPEMLRAMEKASLPEAPTPVPNQLGSPSVFNHVVYIIKENRTYDQVLGDMKQGNGDPSLCLFGRDVTPNHHALAEQFVLLDNYYCNGVLSADGHQWAMEGYVTDYLEKSFGGFTRSYPFAGDDPLCLASSGFLWDNALLHGLSFRNYGEMSKTTIDMSNATYAAVFDDYRAKTGKISFKHQIWIDNLRQYSCPDSPGWNLLIPDAIRADVFLKEFREFEKNGNWPNLVIIFLPSDHTSGMRPGSPTPQAQVADNDLAVGRIVESISRSQYWPETCIFVIEDDPQNGFDHVDGHRSLCLVASPYTKRGAVVSRFYNQTSVLHTMERMLGLPPMNQMDALAPLMTECFTPTPDLAPYACLMNNIPLDQLNKPVEKLKKEEIVWAQKSMEQNLDEVDQADEDTLNKILWVSVRGIDAPYPAHLAGAHGKGLKGLRLKLGSDDDDD